VRSREAVFFVTFVRTGIFHQVLLVKRKISHKGHKEHKFTGACAPQREQWLSISAGVGGPEKKTVVSPSGGIFCIPTIPPESDTTAEFFFAGSALSETAEQNRQSEFLS
jgi:hypothetical protein